MKLTTYTLFVIFLLCHILSAAGTNVSYHITLVKHIKFYAI